MYTDDPISDFNRYDAEQYREEQKLPRCSCCDEPIYEEHYYLINNDVVCEDCLKDQFRKRTEDYVA